jgi:Polyketide cyclase / dehydrase and lipid transport
MDNPTTATLVLAPEGTGTRATWSLDTDFSGSLLGRYFGLALDRMVGPDYEKGLAQLKALAESAQAAGMSTPIGQVTPVPPIPQ